MIRDAAGQLTEEGQMLLDESRRDEWAYEVERLWKEYAVARHLPEGWESEYENGWDPHDYVTELLLEGDAVNAVIVFCLFFGLIVGVTALVDLVCDYLERDLP